MIHPMVAIRPRTAATNEWVVNCRLVWISPAEPVLYEVTMGQAVFCLGCQLTPGTYLGIPMILCGERMGNRHKDNRGMMYLHVETEDKVESPKEEVEVWI